MNFTQIAADLSRPGAGNEQWNEENDVSGVPTPMDNYYRFNWVDIIPANSTDGKADFTMFDQKAKAAFNQGRKFNFAIMQLCDYCGQQVNVGGGKCNYPIRTHNRMQAESVKDVLVDGSWYPNYNSPSFIADYSDVHKQINAHIVAMGWLHQIGYVDINGYGNSGEWTSSDPVIGKPQQGSITSLIAIIDSVLKSYPDIQCVIPFSVYDGNVQLGNTLIQPEVGYYALTAKNNRGPLGWKRESWGQSNADAWWGPRWGTGNTTVFGGSAPGLDWGNAIRTRYLTAPVVGELMNYKDSTSYADLNGQISDAHANSLGNGNLEANVNDPVCQQNARNAFAKMGAKWTITGGNIAGNIMTLVFSNKGLCPTYDNFIIKYYLKQNNVIQYTKISQDLRLLTSDFTEVVDLSAVKAGTYDIYVSIEDPYGFRQPYPLAIQGRLIDGSYLLQSGAVLNGGGPPVPPNPGQDLSVFTTQVPASGTDNDYPAWTNIKGIQCGMKFISSVAGFIKGIKFYKTSGNDGAHVAQLYDATGKLLVSIPFGAETATGWQTVLFPTPVVVLAGTTYIASYFSPNGNYTETNDFLKTADLVNGTLKIPKDGTGGASGKDPGAGNGLYVYTATPAFPNQLFASQNNWVDVIFNTSGGITPPPNQPPVAKVPNGDVTIARGGIALDGSSSSDPEGGILTYQWTKVSGPSGDTIVSPTAAKTNVAGLMTGTYVYSLKVTDVGGLSNTANCTVTVHF